MAARESREWRLVRSGRHAARQFKRKPEQCKTNCRVWRWDAPAYSCSEAGHRLSRASFDSLALRSAFISSAESVGNSSAPTHGVHILAPTLKYPPALATPTCSHP